MTRVERAEAVATPAAANVPEDKNPTGLPERFQVRVRVNDKDKVLCDGRFAATPPHTEMRTAYCSDHGPKGERGILGEFYLKPYEARAYDAAIKSAYFKDGDAEVHHNYSVHRERPGGHPRVIPAPGDKPAPKKSSKASKK